MQQADDRDDTSGETSDLLESESDVNREQNKRSNYRNKAGYEERRTGGRTYVCSVYVFDCVVGECAFNCRINGVEHFIVHLFVSCEGNYHCVQTAGETCTSCNVNFRNIADLSDSRLNSVHFIVANLAGIAVCQHGAALESDIDLNAENKCEDDSQHDDRRGDDNKNLSL